MPLLDIITPGETPSGKARRLLQEAGAVMVDTESKTWWTLKGPSGNTYRVHLNGAVRKDGEPATAWFWDVWVPAHG